jgi:tetratricopeptide (TPR) repeat protein
VPHRSFRLGAAAAVASISIATWGCAGTVTQWMVNLRTSQGDAALDQKSLSEAEKEYALALKLDPHNAHARAGLANVLYLQARTDFNASKLDQAQTEIAEAKKYAPGDAAMDALAAQIDQARIRREVVLANYPLYESVGTSLADSLKTIAATQKEIDKELKAFRSDFDTRHLSKAIVASYDLEDEAHRVTNRLISYRGLVATGAPKGQSQLPSQSETPNLLPIP